MPVADRHIGKLTLEVVPGEPRSIRFTDLDTEAPGVTWTAKAGRGLTIDGTAEVDSGDVVVTFDADATALMVGHPWRVYADGLEAIGENVAPARPQTTPGTASVPVLLADETTVTVTVVTNGGGGADLSDADPEPLAAAAAPGVATEAARIDHEHPRPTPADIGAATSAQGATADTAVQPAGLTSAISTHSADTDPHGDRAYADSQVDALDEAIDGDGVGVRSSGGFLYIDRVGRAGNGVTVASTTSETSTLAAALSFPADSFAVNTHAIRIRFSGKILQNQAATNDVTLRLKVAGSTVWSFPWTAIAQSATARDYRGEATLMFGTFAGTRAFGAGQCTLGAAGTGVGVGTQTVDASLSPTFTLSNAVTFDLTAQLGASAATLTANCTQFIVDVVRVS